MKTRIMFYLVLVVLFVFTGNSFAMGEAEEPINVMDVPSEIDKPEEYDEIIDPQIFEGPTNTFLGQGAGAVTTGPWNTFVGTDAGIKNGTGHRNTFIGAVAGKNNTTGAWNTFVGTDAGRAHTTGDANTFMGFETGIEHTTGNYNTLMGVRAGRSLKTGLGNTFIGSQAGSSSVSGIDNSFFGYGAGFSSKGAYNTFIGQNAGSSNSTGVLNVFLGNEAGRNETGSNKLYIDSTSTSSPLIYGEFDNKIVAVNGSLGVGTQAVPSRFTVVNGGATEATVFPNFSASFFNTGSAFFGFRNTTDNVEGLFGVGGGSGARFGLGSVTDTPIEFLINWENRATIDPVVMLLNTNGSLLMRSGASCTVGGVWQNASSREYKKDIEELTGKEAADVLRGLKPVKFTYKTNTEERHLGFIAEDVPDLVATKDRKSMSPMDVVAVLTKALQEQQKMAQKQQRTISELSKKVTALEEDLRTKSAPTLAKLRLNN